MKFGVNTLIWSGEFDRSLFHLLPGIKAAGFDGIEVPIFHPARFPALEVRRAVSDNGLECNACSVFLPGVSLIDMDPSVRSRAMDHLKICIDTAAEAGVSILAGPFYSPVGYLPGRRRTADEWSRAIDGYREIAPEFAAANMVLALEPLNRFETFFLNTAADAAALCDAVDHPAVGILFDTFHANIEEKDIAAGYRTVGRHLKHVHTCENDRGIPGSGHVEWDAVFTALRDLDYDGWLTIESFGFALPDISAAAAIWRDIERTPESIAFEGVKFVKERAAYAG
ncbi:MAG TPA: sugar phosphate isomerase/epimerase [Bryobacteraceae bacterium]|nr:sugar phosphate isomerase/epimerase [Bryobacteraceae bacterium]